MFHDLLRILEPIQRDIRGGKILVGCDEHRIQTNGFPIRRNRLFVLAEKAQGDAETAERKRLARIGGCPTSREVECLVPVLRRVVVIAPGDEEPLAFADAIAQFERPAGKRRRQSRAAGIRVEARQQRLRQREVRVELDRSLQVRHASEARDEPVLVEAERVRVQRLERRRRGFRERHVELLNRCERLAQLLAHLRRGPPERGQHLLLAGRLHLLARHHVAGLRVDGLEGEHVILPEAGDGAAEQRLQPFALRDLACDRWRDALVRRPPHQTQGLTCPLIAKDFQERRLFERHCERHLQRAVEYRLAGRVHEIG